MLTDDQLTKLALHFEATSITPIDREHHRIVKIVIEDRTKGRERDVKRLEKCLEISTPKGYLFQKIERGFKSLHWFIHCSNPFKKLDNYPDVEEIFYCI